MTFIYIYLMIMALLVTLAFIVAKQERKLKELRNDLYNATKLFVSDRPQPKAPENTTEEYLDQLTILMTNEGAKGVMTSSGKYLMIESLKYTAAVNEPDRLELKIQGGPFLLKDKGPIIQFVKL